MGKQVLDRQLFELSRELEFFTEKELEMQIGHSKDFWRVAILKELIDNALDACEVSETSPEITIEDTLDYFSVQDNGPGLPIETIKRSLNYLIRVSDKQFYISPTRGQMGNALKTVWAAPFVALGQGRITIKSCGYQHVIETSLDRIAQKPQIEHSYEENDLVRNGTSIQAQWPNSSGLETDEKRDFCKADPPTINNLIRDYSAFNPHATFSFKDRHYVSANPEFSKWRTDMPTSAHWYDAFRLRDLIAAYVAQERNNGRPKTVREFVSEFRGLSSTQKQKIVTADFSGVYLHDLIHNDDINISIVTDLLNAMQENSRPVSPQALGIIGEDHFRSWCIQHFNIIPDSFRYSKKTGFENDSDQQLPFLIETAFGVKEDTSKNRTIITGVNWTPTLGIPAREISEGLGKCRIDVHDPVVVIVHMVKPRFEFVDRGKTRIAL